MIPDTTLAMAGVDHERLKSHLFPGDGLEAAAILVCAETPPSRVRLLVRRVILVPHAACIRAADSLTWPGAYIEEAIDVADAESMKIILIHSHPGGFLGFSKIDDNSDNVSIKGLKEAIVGTHGSAVMIPDGAIIARLYDETLTPSVIDLVSVAGDNLQFWWGHNPRPRGGRPLAYTSDMTAELAGLTAIVVGASGTGSPTIEQVGRLGFGKIYAIDFDRMKQKNLNRILNSRLTDAAQDRPKVEVAKDAIDGFRGPGVAVPVALSINTREAVLKGSQGDVVFSCTDTHESRLIADLLSSAFLMPLFDVGVSIPTMRPKGDIAIADVCGRIDYVQPGGSSLMDRGVYSPASLRAEYLRGANPKAFEQEVEAGYIRGLQEEAPAVITLNMRAAAACVSEFIARAYPFRHDPNRRCARTRFSLAACEEEYWSEDSFCATTSAVFAQGAKEPLLGIPELGA